MPSQQDNASRFHALHQQGRPLVLFNVWDAGSARAVANAGAQAIATGSWSVAAANGYEDGERMPLALALDNLRRIVAATTLPVSVDLESGYGADAVAVGSTIAAAIEAGAVGCNLEDSYPQSGKLRDTSEQVARLAQAHRAAQAAGVSLFINARTDVFFQQPAEAHDESMLQQAMERARAYADAGASGLFLPGLTNEALIAQAVARSPLPVNIMVMRGAPTLERLSSLGVARVSHGPGPYRGAMQWLEQAAKVALG